MHYYATIRYLSPDMGWPYVPGSFLYSFFVSFSNRVILLINCNHCGVALVIRSRNILATMVISIPSCGITANTSSAVGKPGPGDAATGLVARLPLAPAAGLAARLPAAGLTAPDLKTPTASPLGPNLDVLVLSLSLPEPAPPSLLLAVLLSGTLLPALPRSFFLGFPRLLFFLLDSVPLAPDWSSL
jgi:hypothetical protein